MVGQERKDLASELQLTETQVIHDACAQRRNIELTGSWFRNLFQFWGKPIKKNLLTFYKYLVTDYLSLSYTILKDVIGFKYKQKAPRDIFKSVNAMEHKPLNKDFMT